MSFSLSDLLTPLCSTKLILSGELGNHAQRNGAKALRAFNHATKKTLR